MSQAVIIHGPQGCGKSRNGDALKVAFNAQRVVDGWVPGEPLQPGDLALTNAEPTLPSDAVWVSFDKAMLNVA